MTREEAINVLRNTAWLGSYEMTGKVEEAINIVAEALKAQPNLQPTCNELATDTISRQAAINAPVKMVSEGLDWIPVYHIKGLPSAQLEPMSDAYMKAVWTWLLDYQIKVAELKGRYTPYEVLSWVANDWRKEHEQRSDQQTDGDFCNM